MITGEVTAKPQVFASAAKWAAKFISLKPIVPVQGGLLLEVRAGRMRISAFSENVEAKAMVDIEGDASGRAIVSGRLLAELVGTFPDKPVTIAGGDGQVVITAGRWTGSLPEMEDGWLTAEAAPGAIGTVDGEEFAAMIASVNTAADKDPDHPAMRQAIGLVFGADRVQAVATDGVRASTSSAPFSGSLTDPVGGAAYGHRLHDVAQAFVGPDTITVGLSATAISLESPARKIVLGLLGEPYPDISLVFQQPRTELVELAAGDLLAPLKRAAMVRAKDGPVRLALGPDLMTVVAEADAINQRSGEEVDVIHSGQDYTIAFNPKMLAEALTSAPGERVLISFDLFGSKERPRSVNITVPGNQWWRHMLMPLRIL